MDEVAENSRRPGPGDRLRTTRERRGLSVRDAAQRLRLDPAVIDALESDDFGRLPAPIFVKGYLNAYGKLLGLPADELIAEYSAATDAAPPPLVVRRGTGEDIDSPASRRILFVGWLVVALLVVGGVATWWYQKQRPAENVTTEPVQRPVEAATVPVPVPAPAEDDASVGTTGDSDAATREVEAEAVPSLERVPAVPSLTARFSYREESWTEIVDATGERLYFDLARAGSVVEVSGQPPLAVFLGNSPGVDIRVDGRPFDQTRYNRSGNVARFRLGTER